MKTNTFPKGGGQVFWVEEYLIREDCFRASLHHIQALFKGGGQGL
jgi:hypothetical protein